MKRLTTVQLIIDDGVWVKCMCVKCNWCYGFSSSAFAGNNVPDKLISAWTCKSPPSPFASHGVYTFYFTNHVLDFTGKKTGQSLSRNIHLRLGVHCPAIVSDITCDRATAEWFFSKLKLIKTYLRGSMGQERLNGLAILSIEKSNHASPLLCLKGVVRQV